ARGTQAGGDAPDRRILGRVVPDADGKITVLGSCPFALECVENRLPGEPVLNQEVAKPRVNYFGIEVTTRHCFPPKRGLSRSLRLWRLEAILGPITTVRPQTY